MIIVPNTIKRRQYATRSSEKRIKPPFGAVLDYNHPVIGFAPLTRLYALLEPDSPTQFYESRLGMVGIPLQSTVVRQTAIGPMADLRRGGVTNGNAIEFPLVNSNTFFSKNSNNGLTFVIIASQAGDNGFFPYIWTHVGEGFGPWRIGVNGTGRDLQVRICTTGTNPETASTNNGLPAFNLRNIWAAFVTWNGSLLGSGLRIYYAQDMTNGSKVQEATSYTQTDGTGALVYDNSIQRLGNNSSSPGTVNWNGFIGHFSIHTGVWPIGLMQEFVDHPWSWYLPTTKKQYFYLGDTGVASNSHVGGTISRGEAVTIKLQTTGNPEPLGIVI